MFSPVYSSHFSCAILLSSVLRLGVVDRLSLSDSFFLKEHPDVVAKKTKPKQICAIVLVNMCVASACVYRFMRCEQSQVRLSVLPWEPVFEYLSSTGGMSSNDVGSQKLKPNSSCRAGHQHPLYRNREKENYSMRRPTSRDVSL